MVDGMLWRTAGKSARYAGQNRSCLFAAESPTDTVDRQNFRTFSTRQIAFLVAERPMPKVVGNADIRIRLYH